MPEVAKDTPAIVESQELESIRTSDFKKLYANSARMETTLWDIKIFFGEVVLSGKPFIEESASVAMSPQHAKALLGVLANHVQEYEGKFGKIPSPEPSKESAPKKP